MSAIKLEALGYTPGQVAWIKRQMWKAVLHMSAEDGNTMIHEIKGLGITRSTFTPKTRAHKDDYMGTFGPSRTSYSVDGEAGPFETLNAALKCVREKYPKRVKSTKSSPSQGGV